jgi:prevent-host-death family protein
MKRRTKTMYTFKEAYMLEINVKEMRSNLSALLERVERGEEIIITRHGKKVARLISARNPAATLPSLDEFRSTIKVTGEPLSKAVIAARKKERH